MASASLRLLVQLRITALAPRLAAPTAMAAPRPVAPPVTRITLPSKSAIARSSYGSCYRVRRTRAPRQPAGVRQHLGMVEGQLDLGPVGNPLGRGGVVAGPGLGPRGAGKKDDRAGVPARVALGVGVDADELQPAGLDARSPPQARAERRPPPSRRSPRSRRAAHSGPGTVETCGG